MKFLLTRTISRPPTPGTLPPLREANQKGFLEIEGKSFSEYGMQFSHLSIAMQHISFIIGILCSGVSQEKSRCLFCKTVICFQTEYLRAEQRRNEFLHCVYLDRELFAEETDYKISTQGKLNYTRAVCKVRVLAAVCRCFTEGRGSTNLSNGPRICSAILERVLLKLL
jgi:hypothetical protein